MSVKFMRYIDYWLGAPLCFLISALNSIARIFSSIKKRNENIYKNILFIKPTEIGAIILAHPLLKRVNEEYPDAELFFLTFEKNKNVFELFGELIKKKNIITIREESLWLFILDTLRAIRKIRKEGIHITFDLEMFSRFTAILAYLSKADKTIGFHRYTFEGLYRGSFLTHYIQYNPLLHISKTYLSMSQVLKRERKSTPELEEKIKDTDIVLPRFVSSTEKRNQMEAKLKEFQRSKGDRLILINPGEGNLPLREWPLKNFIALSKRLLEDNKNYLIFIGTKESHRKTELLYLSKEINSKRFINLTGKTSISDLLELCSISDILIANDCGLAHLASLTSIKKFIIFGPESPQIFGPLGENNHIIYSFLPCSPCLSVFNHRDSTCRDNRCLKIIKPNDVYELIIESSITSHKTPV